MTIAGVVLVALLASCESNVKSGVAGLSETNVSEGQDASAFLVVDCLLPGQVRKLGGNLTYVTPRRPVKTTTSDCEIRGGEYVAYDRADYSSALKIWLPMAEQGDPEAQTYVGEIYEKGLGLLPDFQAAAHWYQQAVQQGHSRAQINLGHLYEKGLGVPQDQQQALNLYRQASGITSDSLMFASTLTAHYVPREQFEGMQQELQQELQQQQQEQLQQQQQRKLLEQKIIEISRKLDHRSALLVNTEQQLQVTQQALAELNQQQAAPLAQDALPQDALSQDSAPLRTEQERSEKETALMTRITQLEKERQQLAVQLSRISQQNQQLDQQRQAMEANLSQATSTKADYQQQLQQLQRELAQSKQHLQESESTLTTLEQRLQEERAGGAELTPIILALQDDLAAKTRELIDERSRYEGIETANRQQQQQLREALAEVTEKQRALNNENRTFKEQLSTLNTTLAEREQQLAETDQRLLLRQAELNLARSEQKKALAKLSDQHAVELQQQHEQMAQLTQQFQQQLALVSSQKQQIQDLQAEAVRFQNELTTSAPPAAIASASEPTVASDFPGIEIIEPPVVLTRSQPAVRLRSLQGERQVVGKVLAPAGLMSLTVNGHAHPLGSNNLFRTQVPLHGDPTPVDVVVVDNKGRRAAVSFSFVTYGDEAAGKGVGQGQPGKVSAAKSIETALKQHGMTDRQIPLAMGQYHALIIGNNDYQNFSTLSTAINDAKMTDKLLREKYHFKTKLLLDADRYTILSALNELRQSLQADDNLLIYYAGHGRLDEANNRGYWLPIDAEVDSTSNWISNTAITDILNVMAAKHILVVADSCYAGTLTETPLARLETEIPPDVRAEWIKAMAETRARITLTSGGVEPVLDGGGGSHSVFAKAFLDTLSANDDILEGYALYAQVLSKIAANPAAQNQVPQYAPIHLAGHEAGEFFFNPS